MEDNGFWIVRSKPVIAAFSSDSAVSFSEEVDLRGLDVSPSVECLGLTSGRLKADFSDS
jgi:hypothetical protein